MRLESRVVVVGPRSGQKRCACWQRAKVNLCIVSSEGMQKIKIVVIQLECNRSNVLRSVSRKNVVEFVVGTWVHTCRRVGRCAAGGIRSWFRRIPTGWSLLKQRRIRRCVRVGDVLSRRKGRIALCHPFLFLLPPPSLDKDDGS